MKTSTLGEHPDGAAANDGVVESGFDPIPDLSAPATVVDAYTATVDDRSDLADELDAAVGALEEGQPAVLDVRLEPI